jgi:hypothetical protein
LLLAVCSNRVHLVADYVPVPIGKVVSYYKNAAQAALRNAGLAGRVWTKGFNVMRKVWIYKRRNIKGWWVGWYESGKRKAKALPSKALAEHFRQIKYTQLNSYVFFGTVAVDWTQMRDEYEHNKKSLAIRMF